VNTYRLTAMSTKWNLDPRVLQEYVPAAGFVALWSTGYIAGKIAINQAAPFTTLALRFGSATLLFVLLALVKRNLARPSGRELLHSAVC
jgi:drug/metabolite transporter (DMT)-like permease